MKNDGSKSEKRFAELIAKFGKIAYLERLIDTKTLSRKNMAIKTYVPKRPSDWILTINGQMGYTEIKSTTSTVGFSFGSLTVSQNSALVRQCAAKGHYWIFVHRLETDDWYWLHGHTIMAIRAEGRQSMKWDELEYYKWVLPTTNMQEIN